MAEAASMARVSFVHHTWVPLRNEPFKFWQVLNVFPHYWTLWWRPWRGATSPHCGQTRPWRATVGICHACPIWTSGAFDGLTGFLYAFSAISSHYDEPCAE